MGDEVDPARMYQINRSSFRNAHPEVNVLHPGPLNRGIELDDAVADGDTIVLRMFGHLSSQGGAITSVVFQLPNPGDRLLFALGRNPDETYGTGPQGLLDVSGETVAFADGVPFEPRTSLDQLMKDIRDVASECVGNARTRRCEG